MRKVVIGCVVLIVVLAVSAGAASYYLYHKVDSTLAGFKELGTVPELERSVRNQAPFTPPASGELLTTSRVSLDPKANRASRSPRPSSRVRRAW